MNRLVEVMKNMAEDDGNMENPGWMEEFFNYLVKYNQIIFFIDENDCMTAFMGYWRFGNRRWKFIKKAMNLEHNPGQMTKGNHLYIPIIVVRHDKRLSNYMPKFLSFLKEKVPDALTISWHDNESQKFRTHKIVRRN